MQPPWQINFRLGVSFLLQACPLAAHACGQDEFAVNCPSTEMEGRAARETQQEVCEGWGTGHHQKRLWTWGLGDVGGAHVRSWKRWDIAFWTWLSPVMMG